MRTQITDDSGPIWCGEYERQRPEQLFATSASPAGGPYRRARVLVRDSGWPVAFVEVRVANGAVDMEAVRRYTDGQTPTAPVQAPSATADAVSVVVCTRDRPEFLRRCLDGLLRLKPAPIEIVVVNNSPYA